MDEEDEKGQDPEEVLHTHPGDFQTQLAIVAVFPLYLGGLYILFYLPW